MTMINTYFRKSELGDIAKKILVLSLLLTLVSSPFVSASNNALAQEVGQPPESEQSDSSIISDTPPPDEAAEEAATPPEPDPEVIDQAPPEETPPSDEPPTPSPDENQEEVLDPPVVAEPAATTTEELVPTGKKFKKDPSLSPEEQLAAVREHLLREGLPQVAIERLDAFEAKRAEGPTEEGVFKRVFNFLIGNTDEMKEQKEIERLINSEPFKVENFEGEINTASADRYEKDFSDAKEQGGFIQKVKNLIESGTFFNSDFDRTEEKKGGILSWLFGTSRAIADASDNHDDYMDEGGEIRFTQSVQDQADALNNDPLDILNFVLNDVEYVPYYGSKKGADAALLERAGNDMDKASLLVAMLRYSGVPARYRHVDAKMEVDTVNALLGMPNATSSAQLLSLSDIPYTLYTSSGESVFFVIEHTYVEAYLPYGVSRGTDPDDGGLSQWVPMDPTVTEYSFEQPFDVVGEMTDDGFNIEDFFGDYLNGDYGTSTEPLDAFMGVVDNYLSSSSTPGYFPDGLTYDDAIMKAWPRNDDLDFIPGSLPFEISADLNTYDFVPDSLRHTLEFTVIDDSNEVLNHTAYVSDLADREIVLSYEAALTTDQTIIDGFDTIYDVVPLSLAAVTPKLKVAGDTVATGTATSTMGVSQDYEMEFYAPVRVIGEPVDTELVKNAVKSIIAGTSDGIAINTDRVVPFAMLPDEQLETDSFLSDQLLYKTAVDYLFRLESTQRELVNITGRDFVTEATRASISNGVDVTYSMGDPYSFEWKGLRIDASAKVHGFSRFKDISNNKAEFYGIFGLQASQDESDIFEDNFEVESVATVKGLKLVADGEFAGVTLEKITEANEGDIDSLSISTSTKNAFHDAVGNGRIIYTPSEPITYEGWEGLFYIAVDFDGGDGTYAIGEGLNGGYTVTIVAQWPNGVPGLFLKPVNLGLLTADIITPSNNSTHVRGTDIPWKAKYYAPGGVNWTENLKIPTLIRSLGTHIFGTGYGTTDTVSVRITNTTLGGEGNNSTLDKEIIDAVDRKGLDPQFASILKLIFEKETKSSSFTMRYEPCIDKDIAYGLSRINQHPYRAWRLPGNGITQGAQVSSLKAVHGKTPQQMIRDFSVPKNAFSLNDNNSDGYVSIYEAWLNNDDIWNYSEYSCGSSRITAVQDDPAQFLIASSYGLGQVVYAHHAKKFDDSPDADDARDIWDLFFRKANIDIAAGVLADNWDIYSGTSGSSCNTGDRLWKTIGSYNGDISFSKAQNYATDICKKYKQGGYALITQ